MYLKCDPRDTWNQKVCIKDTEDLENRIFASFQVYLPIFNHKNAEKEQKLAKLAIFKVLDIFYTNFQVPNITRDTFQKHQSLQIANNLHLSFWTQNFTGPLEKLLVQI